MAAAGSSGYRPLVGGLTLLGVGLAVVSLAWSSPEPPPQQGRQQAAPSKKKGARAEDAKAKADARKGGLRLGGNNPPEELAATKPDDNTWALDPLYRSLVRAQAREAGGRVLPPALPEWPYHFTLTLTGRDGRPLAATYYPARGRENAPVVLLVHDLGTGHAAKDFEQPIEGLNPPRSLAAWLQEQDYAVLTLDLRGHGGSVLRRAPAADEPAKPAAEAPAKPAVRPDTARAARAAAAASASNEATWTALAGDLRTAYLFLVDRHNRQELNVAKLGVIALGDGGILATHWAVSSPSTGPISGPGRPSDLAALALVSPVAEAHNLALAPALNELAPRTPVFILGGSKDEDLAKQAQETLERHRLGRLQLFETRTQGDVLLRLEPKAAEALALFLEEPVKFRTDATWQPRYLLTPTTIADVKLVDPARAETPAPPAPAEPNAAPAAADPNAPAPAPVEPAADPNAPAPAPAPEPATPPAPAEPPATQP